MTTNNRSGSGRECNSVLLDSELFTPGELSKLTKLHSGTIRRLFIDEPGVVRIGHSGGRRRQYFTIRIPRPVAERVLGELTVSGLKSPSLRA